MARIVLLIDDSPAIARQVEARLAGEDVVLHYASDGENGLKLARELTPDLILLDVEMPSPDGFEVCRRLKLDQKLIGTPVIFLSGAAGTSDKILGLELGAVDFLNKPFDPADLRARVRTALTIKRLSDLLSDRARVDGITGLWNSAYFDARLTNEIALANRSARPVSIIVADIDHFKSLNSEHGQWFGDHVLRSVAELCANSCRAEDVLCRVTAGEFGIICPSSTAQGAAVLADRLCMMISRLKFAAHGSDLRITASFGVAGIEQAPAKNLTDCYMLSAAAFRALAQAKERGRNHVIQAGPEMFPAIPLGPSTRPIIERRGPAPKAA